MAVTLVLRSRDSNESEDASVTFDQERVVIGRGDSCDFRVPEPSVSLRHASVRQRGTDLVVVDEGSTNGTFLGSLKLHAQTPTVLRNGSMVRCGRVWLEVRFEEALPTAHPALATKELALAMVAKVLGDEGQGAGPRLVVREGPDQGREVSLSESNRPVVIGRGRDVDFPIDVEDASRRHARVMRRGDVALLRDLGSRNGTQVGSKLAPVNGDATLRPGDAFEIGPDVFVFEHPAVEALHRIELAEDEALSKDGALGQQPKSSVRVTPPPEPIEDKSGTGLERSAKPEPSPAHPRNLRRRSAKKGPGWGKTDVLIVLLALVVLGLSTVGIVWLFRGS